ncbi:MAG: LysR substrate-binding domain-containing protein [Candidatus Sulfotelmatobacter sp.]
MYQESKEGVWAQKATLSAQQAERLSNNLPEVHLSLGSVYSATGKNTQAVVELKRALELAPNSDEVYRIPAIVQTCAAEPSARTGRFGRPPLQPKRAVEGLKVACPVTTARDTLAPLLREFLERYPELRVEIEPYAASWDQEPRDDVDVFFFKLRAPKDSLRRVRPYPGTVRGLFASQNYLKDAGDLSIYRPRMTSRSTTASAPDPGS